MYKRQEYRSLDSLNKFVRKYHKDIEIMDIFVYYDPKGRNCIYSLMYINKKTGMYPGREQLI